MKKSEENKTEQLTSAAAFDAAAIKVISTIKEKKSIGLLKEKSVHATLKFFLEADENNHEIKLGKYCADICSSDGNIYEIQTRQFNKLRDKLDYFLKDRIVTVVYPVIRNKYIVWLDPVTFEIIGNKKKSPKKGCPQMIFPELYKIKSYLKNPFLKIKIIEIDATEYRILDGYGANYKNKATKYDIIPDHLLNEIDINSPADYLKLVPESLPEHFTVKDIKSNVIGCNISTCQSMANILRFMDITALSGKQGKSNLYKIKSDYDI